MNEKIKNVLKKVFGIENVEDNFSQQNCEKWDSLRHLNLVIELEEEFNVSFEPEDIAEMKDIDSIIRKIQALQC
ncbi:Acyl carrier protein [termite gut metagenome]|uniref:Acyl carrier protein n=1 Tax=termite gut metagenome TaxID=433724 RepID=A0A5J4R8M0_9ZZZZ